MEEKIYQNFDQPQENPLEIVPEKKLKISLSPKIILLIILGSIIFVLLLLSLVVTQTRHSANKTVNIIPTPTTVTINSDNNNSLIPSPYQSEFQKINNYTSQDLDLPAPQVDTEIGL
ncbi:MAG: hypothetical protein WC784_03480 [Candidatus Shapirobacteria bacterium]|jgi:hypothetical protein